MKSSDSLDDPVKIPCEVLIYQSWADPLILNTYVVPSPSPVKKDIEDEWKGRGAIYIKKSPPNESFRINSNFKLSTNCLSDINHEEISLTDKHSPAYFEVCIDKPGDVFRMELKVPEDRQDRLIWKAAIRKGADYKTTMPTRSADQDTVMETRAEVKDVVDNTNEDKVGTRKVKKNRKELIKRIGDATLKSVLDGLQEDSPNHPVIILRERNEVLQKHHVTDDQVTCLVDMLLNKGERPCETFLSLLRELEPNLCDELGL